MFDVMCRLVTGVVGKENILFMDMINPNTIKIKVKVRVLDGINIFALTRIMAEGNFYLMWANIDISGLILTYGKSPHSLLEDLDKEWRDKNGLGKEFYDPDI